MNSKLLMLSLLSAPLIAQDAQTPETPVKSEPEVQEIKLPAEMAEAAAANPGAAFMLALLSGAANASAEQDAKNAEAVKTAELANSEVAPVEPRTAELTGTESSVAQTRTAELSDAAVAPEPTAISVEFKFFRNDASVTDEAWTNIKQLLSDCQQQAKEKQFEQSLATFDRLVNEKPEAVGGTITVNASQKDRSAEQAGVTSLVEEEGASKVVMCEIYRNDISAQAWQQLCSLAYEIIGAQDKATYERAREVAFAIISKS